MLRRPLSSPTREAPARYPLQNVVFVVGFLVCAVVYLAIMMASLNVPRLPPMPVQRRSHPSVPLYWKTDPNLQPDTVRSRFRYWEYVPRIKRPDYELVDATNEEQYLTFEPDKGGLNNKRMMMEIMVVLALVTRRTFVLPSPGYWTTMQGICDLETYFDIDALRSFMPVITMDEYLLRTRGKSDLITEQERYAFLRNHTGAFSPQINPGSQAFVFPADQGRSVPTMEQFLHGRSPIYYDGALKPWRTLHFRSDYEQGYRMLGVACAAIYFPSLDWERFAASVVRDAFHYAPAAFDAAARVAWRLYRAAGPYNAVHIRRTDFGLQFADIVLPLGQVAENIRPLLDPSMTLYVSTDVQDKDDPELVAFRAVFPKVRFLSDVSDDLADLDPNLFIMIDQIVCAGAERFISQPLSTFSSNIWRLRGFMGRDVAPDTNLYMVTDRNTGYPMVDGWRTALTWIDHPDGHFGAWSGGYWEREFFHSWQLN
ncbi:unnamed protein product (mitochondrion) [Plasmodiophora brassicae]|uniref:O-fucosyltransferase family protein n=1 Tax=Plasmodiophora brassicae TaxID=37360 RepID=A0A0G4IP57_PLABS|nr:hypothetical protein PBRA_005640 [Plasmodiophora brassicae]SPR01017.1 unnamed protein product [Plasmodiophora brassicae]